MVKNISLKFHCIKGIPLLLSYLFCSCLYYSIYLDFFLLLTPWQRRRGEQSAIRNNVPMEGHTSTVRHGTSSLMIIHSLDGGCNRNKKWKELILHMGNSKTLIHSDCSLKILILLLPRVPQHKNLKELMTVGWGKDLYQRDKLTHKW